MPRSNLECPKPPAAWLPSAAPPKCEVDPTQLDALHDLLKTEEGYRTDVYLDTRKIPTVGIGHKILPADNLAVGERIDENRVRQLFEQDGHKAVQAAQAQSNEAGIADPAFVTRLGAVNFQLGTGWTGDFKDTWTKIVAGDYHGAAENLGRSLWAQQTPARVKAFQDSLLRLPPKPGP